MSFLRFPKSSTLIAGLALAAALTGCGSETRRRGGRRLEPAR